MLNCVYHFTGDMQVVDDYEKDALIASGAWFDHPTKAKEYREKLLAMDEVEEKPVLKKRKVKTESKL